MHQFPDQHFPSLLCPRLEAAHPLDNCGELSAVKSDDAGGAGQDFRCQYENISRSGLVLRAEEPAIPFLFIKKRARRQETTSKHTKESFYGGCLSYAPFPSKECAGLLFHPRTPDLKGLSVFPIRLQKIEENEQKIIRHTAALPTQKMTPGKHSEQLLQIETMSGYEEGNIVTALRCESTCHIVNVKVDSQSAKLEFKDAEVIKCEQKPTSIAISPYIQRECLISHEDGTMQLFGNDRSVQKITPDWDDAGQPCWGHYSSHPRIVLVHQARQLDLLDIRVGSKASGQTCLMSLPCELLARNQEIQVVRQHPVNYFYHLVATQDSLILLDERFPKYHVLQWFHHMTSPPVCLDIINKALPTDDMVIVSSYMSAQSHCLQFSCLNGETPISTCPIWKASPMNSWLDLMPDVPTCHSFHEVKGYLHKPLIGTCTAQHTVGQGLDIFQVSDMGDIFQQTFIPSSDDNTKDKTCIPGPGSGDIILSKESQKICRNWMDERLFKVRKRQVALEGMKVFANRLVSRTDILEGFKQVPEPDPNCQVCCKTSQIQDTPHPPKTPRLAQETCPACGIPLNSNLTDYLKRTRTSILHDKDIVKSEMVPVDTVDISDEKLPWEPVKYNEYSDDIGRLLLRDWKFDQMTGQEASSQMLGTPLESSQSLETPLGLSQSLGTHLESSQSLGTPLGLSQSLGTPLGLSQSLGTPLAHPASASMSVPTHRLRGRLSPRRRAFVSSQSQDTQAPIGTTPRSPQKKITARRKLLKPNYTLGF